jgi:ornithine carbamoyltransferase
MKTFNDLAELSNEEISALLELADRLDKHPEPHALQGKVLSLLFLSPSLRTLASFQAAMTRLGGGSFVISPDMSIHGLETRPGIVMDGAAAEHINEAIPVIASYGDAIGIRAFAERKNLEHDMAETEFNAMTSLIDTPWINMESAMNHPCQNLADWKTLDDLDVPANGGKFVLSWAFHPKALPLAVPASTLYTAARRGMDVTVLRPEGFEPRRRPPADPCRNRTTGPKRCRVRMSSMQSPGRRRDITVIASTTRSCATDSSTGASTSRGSITRRRTAASCTACPYAAASSSAMPCWTGLAAS